MDIESLNTFLVLSNTRNYTRAANQLFVAQSTVTNRINELEKELNFSLFSRTNRNVELTKEGEQFKEYAQKVISLTNSSLSSISSNKKYENHLRIGCANSIYEGHLSSIILSHYRNHPKDSLKITIGLSNHLIEQLLDNIYDVVFTYLPVTNSKFQCEIYKHDELILVTDYKNSKYENGISKDELISENYLMCNYALQDVGQYIRNLFPKYHQFALEVDDCSKIIPFIFDSNNYTFLPSHTAIPYLEAKKLKSIDLLDLKPPVINSYMICKKAKYNLCKSIF